MANSKKYITKLKKSNKEGNARKGYCSTAFFAQASDIPSVVSQALPDDAFCTLEDMYRGMKKVERHMLKMSTHKGRHMVLLDVVEARELIQSLVLADTAIGLNEEMNPVPFLTQEHQVIVDTVRQVQHALVEVQKGAVTFERFRENLGKLPNQELVSSILSMIGKKVPIIQTRAGPIDLKTEKLKIKEVASERGHSVTGRVTGGYDEHTCLVTVEVIDLLDADPALFIPAGRVKVQVISEEHRVNLLLAQLAKSQVRIVVNVPRIPLIVTSPGKVDLLCDLRELEILGQGSALATIKESVINQLGLDI